MKKGYLYIVMSTFLFSTMEIAIKLSGSMFNPLQLNFLRFLIGGLVLFPLAISRIRKNHLHFARRDVIFFILTSFLCVVVSMTFFQLAIEYTKASEVAVLFSCNPAFVLILAALFLHEKMPWLTVVSIIVSLIGLVIIIDPAKLTDPLGISFAVIAAITFAIYSVISRYGTKKYHYNGIVITCFSFLFGSIELGILMISTHIPIVANFMHQIGLHDFSKIPFIAGISWQTLPMLAYLGIFVTGVGFSSYFLAMEEISVSLASLVFFIKPALAPILALFILGESISPIMIIGIIIILFGSLLTFIASRAVPKIILEKEQNKR